MFLTDAEEAERVTLQARRTRVVTDLRDIDLALEKLGSAALTRALRDGRWKVTAESGGLFLTPADKATEGTLVNLVSELVRLDYHDRVLVVSDGPVRTGAMQIIASFNDGDLSLWISGRPEMARDGMKKLGIDVDLRKWVTEHVEEQLGALVREVESTNRKMDKLRAVLADMAEEEARAETVAALAKGEEPPA